MPSGPRSLGLLLLATVNNGGAVQRVAPPGGLEPRLSTNPFCAGVPTADPDAPIVVDFGTSVVAEGKVRDYFISGRPVPEGWLLDHQGRPTTDPSVLYESPKGTILPARRVAVLQGLRTGTDPRPLGGRPLRRRMQPDDRAAGRRQSRLLPGARPGRPRGGATSSGTRRPIWPAGSGRRPAYPASLASSCPATPSARRSWNAPPAGSRWTMLTGRSWSPWPSDSLSASQVDGPDHKAPAPAWIRTLPCCSYSRTSLIYVPDKFPTLLKHACLAARLGFPWRRCMFACRGCPPGPSHDAGILAGLSGCCRLGASDPDHRIGSFLENTRPVHGQPALAGLIFVTKILLTPFSWLLGWM